MKPVFVSEQDILTVISGFDVHYQRSDDPEVFANGMATWNMIQSMYHTLSEDEKPKAVMAMKKRGIPVPIKFKPTHRKSPKLKPFLTKDEINRKFEQISEATCH